MGYGMPKEAADITIRVPSSLRDDLNELKDKIHAGTPHEAIRKLITYRETAEKEKSIQKVNQEKNMLDVGEDGKKKFLEIKEDLALRTDAAVLEFLTECYLSNIQYMIGPFEVYKNLKKAGK